MFNNLMLVHQVEINQAFSLKELQLLNPAQIVRNSIVRLF
jgi:hypothetical protein